MELIPGRFMALIIIGLLVGWILGYYMGQQMGLNWCANRAIEFLKVKGYDLTANTMAVQGTMTTIYYFNPNSTGRISQEIKKILMYAGS